MLNRIGDWIGEHSLIAFTVLVVLYIPPFVYAVSYAPWVVEGCNNG